MTLKAFEKVNIAVKTHYWIRTTDGDGKLVDDFTVDYNKTCDELTSSICKKHKYINDGVKVEYVTTLSGESGIYLDVTCVTKK